MSGNGYGQMYQNERAIAAHRFSFKKAFGIENLRRDQFICHKCDNPKCVNPEHLFLGTAADNMRDKAQKGRCNVPLGIAHGRAKLTNENVLEIRNSPLKAQELSEKFGVHPQHIRLIRRRKRVWNHV